MLEDVGIVVSPGYHFGADTPRKSRADADPQSCSRQFIWNWSVEFLCEPMGGVQVQRQD